MHFSDHRLLWLAFLCIYLALFVEWSIVHISSYYAMLCESCLLSLFWLVWLVVYVDPGIVGCINFDGCRLFYWKTRSSSDEDDEDDLVDEDDNAYDAEPDDGHPRDNTNGDKTLPSVSSLTLDILKSRRTRHLMIAFNNLPVR